MTRMECKIFTEYYGRFHMLACLILIACQVPSHISAVATCVSFLLFGGWRTVRIFFKTFRRNIGFVRLMIKAKLKLRSIMRAGDLVPEIFAKVANAHPDKVAFLCEEESWTLRDVERYMNRVANVLRECDISSGSVVGIFAFSRPQYVCLWMGAVRAGLIPALINFNLRGTALSHCLVTTKAKVLIFDSELAPAVNEINDSLSECQRVFYVAGSAGSDVPGAEDLETKLKRSRPDWQKIPTDTKLTDLMMYIFTSGTTGLPKPAVVTHVRYYLSALVPRIVYDLTTKDVFYTVLPLYHSAGGLMGVGQALMFGSCVVIKKKFSATTFWTDCAKYNVTVIQYIGEICRYLLARPASELDKRHNVRLALGNGLRPALWRSFRQRFGLQQIGEFYAATESNANLINTDNTEGAIGFMIPVLFTSKLVRVDMETGELIRDRKTGKCIECRPGEPGQIIGKIIRNDVISEFCGYLNKKDNEKKIARNVFSKGDSYFLSGDILVMDELRYVYFQDRTGDTFRWQGENVSTVEVESIVIKALNLSSCAAYGVEIPGTEGKACMVAIEENKISVNMKTLQQELEKLLPSYARPMFIRFTRDIDITGTFKIKKIDLMKTGFNIERTDDRIFYFDRNRKDYQPLTKSVYDDIMLCNLRF